MIGAPFTVARLEREGIDQLNPRAASDDSASASSARETPRRRHAGAMTKHTMTAASYGAHGNGVAATRMRSKQCGSLWRGCAFSQPTGSSPAKARKPSISPTSMRACIATRFCAADNEGQSIATGTS